MASAVNVLLVETDELELRERTEQLLMDGYAVDSVGAVNEARVRLAEAPDALVLSRGSETIGLLRALRAGEVPRADSRLPVLVLGVDADSAPVPYYRAGADVALPSETSGLLVAAGLEALIRRAGPQETRVVRVGGLTVDRDARTAQVENRPVKLTRLEFDLLATLASEPRRTFTRAELPARCGAMTRRRRDHRAPWTGTHIGSDRSSSRRAPSRWCRPSAVSAGGSPDEDPASRRDLRPRTANGHSNPGSDRGRASGRVAHADRDRRPGQRGRARLPTARRSPREPDGARMTNFKRRILEIDDPLGPSHAAGPAEPSAAPPAPASSHTVENGQGGATERPSTGRRRREPETAARPAPASSQEPYARMAPGQMSGGAWRTWSGITSVGSFRLPHELLEELGDTARELQLPIGMIVTAAITQLLDQPPEVIAELVDRADDARIHARRRARRRRAEDAGD